MMNSRYVSVKQGVYQTLSFSYFFKLLSLEIPPCQKKHRCFDSSRRNGRVLRVVGLCATICFKIQNSRHISLPLFSLPLEQSFPLPRRSREPQRRRLKVVSHSSRLPGDMLPVSSSFLFFRVFRVSARVCVYSNRETNVY